MEHFLNQESQSRRHGRHYNYSHRGALTHAPPQRDHVISSHPRQNSISSNLSDADPLLFLDDVLPTPLEEIKRKHTQTTAATAATAASNEEEEEDCPICLERLRPILPITMVVRNEPQQQLTVRLEGCGHLFHAACLNAAVVQSKPACPNCRHELGRASTGKMPSGTMTIVPVATGDCSLLLSVNNNNHHHHHHHHGNNNNCCIAIYYDFPAGYQKAFHPAPGMLHQAANFTAYLPDHAQGRALLERLKQAFAGGLTFLVGSSFGSNNTLPNPICEWIPHKPSLEALLADDPGFWHNCHKQLDLVGVPNAASYPS